MSAVPSEKDDGFIFKGQLTPLRPYEKLILFQCMPDYLGVKGYDYAKVRQPIRQVGKTPVIPRKNNASFCSEL